MSKLSAGLLLYRRRGERVEVLLVHPGGPFWKNKDDGAWSIPKGEIEPGEDLLEAARREFAEETGHAVHGPFLPLGEVHTRAGKRIVAWGTEGDLDATAIASNTFNVEWPPRSGRLEEFPEVDRAAFFEGSEAKRKIHAAQSPLVDRLFAALEFPAP
jgi:predicted NUDIX family NTP pyrophosphohydrolase